MFKLLLSFWWTQWRRNFRWGRFLGVLYFGGLMLLMTFAMLFAANEAFSEQLSKLPLSAFAFVMVAILALPDFLMKLMWGTDAVVMDDVLRTKPIPNSAWNRFVAFSLVADLWNWLMPLLMALIGFWLLPTGVAILAIVASIVQSQMLSWLVADIHKAPGNQYTLPLWAGMIAYYLGTLGIGILLAMLAIVPDIGLSLPGSPWTELLLLIVLDCVLIVVLYRYFGRMHAYDEHEQHADTVRSVGDVTLFSTEYLSVCRSKRFRLPMLLIIGLFLFQAYQQQAPMMQSSLFGLNIGLYFVIGWPSLFLGQWVFGIEGNYFHGLWTKPYSIERMLLNKYKFFVMLTVAVAVLLIPAIFLAGLRPTTLIALTLFLGFGQSLLLMPTCLFSTRVDLFTSAFFNYQGSNMGINLYSLVMLIPMLIYILTTVLLPSLWSDAIMAAIGLAAWIAYRPCIRLLAKRWQANRYAHMERYLK